jgi:uncharacterized protein (DUF302 family)
MKTFKILAFLICMTCTKVIASNDTSRSVSMTTIPHIDFTLKSSFNSFTAKLEKLLGHFDPKVLRTYARNPQVLKERLTAMQGFQDLMLFDVEDHGSLLIIYGKTQKAKQYLIGNPLIAASMTHIDIRAALYAPLRMLVYEGTDRLVHVAYDLPSAQFGQFKNAGVTAVGKKLDSKLMHLIREADRKSK